MSAHKVAIHLWAMDPGNWWRVACGRRVASVIKSTQDPREMTCIACAKAVAEGRAVVR